MGLLDDLGSALGSAASAVGDAAGTVVETVCDTGAEIIEAVTEAGAAVVEAGSEVAAAGTELVFEVVAIVVEGVAGEEAGESVRRLGGIIAAGIRRGGRVLGGYIRGIGRWLANNLRQVGRIAASIILRIFSPPKLVRTYSQADKHSPVLSIKRTHAYGFNISDVSSQYGYNDSGAYYEVKINNEGQVCYRNRSTGGEWRLLVPEGDVYNGNIAGPIAISYHERRGKGNAEPKHERDFDIAKAPVFEMVAAGENRIFAKEVDTDNFYIAAIVSDFLKYRKSSNDVARDVPGFYAKLDPEYAKLRARFDDYLLIDKHRYNRHVSLNNFLLYNVGRRIDPLYPRNRPLLPLMGLLAAVLLRVAAELRPDLMLVRFDPAIWHRLDPRPPYDSGVPPVRVETYRHVDYGWDLGLAGRIVDRYESSIRFRKVLGMGVGRLHRHTHYDSSQGGELHVLAFNMGPIGDFASFFDGTCNYYLLGQLQDDPIHQDRQASLQNAYGLLWIDEQTYYSERWRLVHPEDNKWNPGREFVTFAGSSAIGYSPYRDPDRYPELCWFEEERFWCPFKSGFVYGGSRLAVARQTCLVSGRVPSDANLAGIEHLLQPGDHLLFSLVFSWGSTDRTWRWRKFPASCLVLSEADEKALIEDRLHPGNPTDQGDICYPQLIGLRDDMTITVRGSKVIDGAPQQGYWVTKYLPADGWEHPFLDENDNDIDKRRQLELFGNQQTPPKEGYNHEWRFVLKENFHLINRYSHFGNYGDVDSRSQYYEISVAPDSLISAEDLQAALEEGNDPLRWIDYEDSLVIYYPYFDYSAFEDLFLGGFPNNRLYRDVHQPPSFFNSQTAFRIAHRPRWYVPGAGPQPGPPGAPRFIATLWDKRDDDLAGLQLRHGTGGLTLMADPWSKSPLAGKMLKIYLNARQVVWKTPVVQHASVSVDSNAQTINLSFSSTISRRPRYFNHWKRIEDYLGMGVDLAADLVRELGLDPEHPFGVVDYDNWILAQLPSFPPDVVPFEIDHDPSSVDPYAEIGYPCPDTTIHCVRINALEQGEKKNLLNIPITSFSAQTSEAPFVFSYRWEIADKVEFENNVRFLISPGIYTYATHIVFEDLVGHVATPESVEYLVEDRPDRTDGSFREGVNP